MKYKEVGGMWEKGNRFFIRMGSNYYNAYKNENKRGNQPDWKIYIGKKEAECLEE